MIHCEQPQLRIFYYLQNQKVSQILILFEPKEKRIMDFLSPYLGVVRSTE